MGGTVNRVAATTTVLASAPLRREQAGHSERPGRLPCGGSRPPSTAAMRIDPNTHAFVMATAFLTSVSFAILAMNVLALVLSHVLA